MRIETNQHLETAIARLASRTPETLATFIASLLFDAGPIGEQVRTFIVGDNLAETTASLKERIEARDWSGCALAHDAPFRAQPTTEVPTLAVGSPGNAIHLAPTCKMRKSPPEAAE